MIISLSHGTRDICEQSNSWFLFIVIPKNVVIILK